MWLFSQPRLGQGDVWHRTLRFRLGLDVRCRPWWSWRSGATDGCKSALSYSRIVWLGKISYGLYMYHEIAIWMRRRFLNSLPWFPNKDELLTIATFALVIAMAAISYYAFERRFLVWKRAWTRVPSRPV